ncbi:MAG: hypothetical protein E6J87_25720 [Deltaproteobacteria bacterium]|nr:MAG: hypothetical protein E6J87_25720 [Deltaproteobacteria bacterium]
MKILARWMVGLLALAAGILLVFAVSVFVWACSALPSEMSPPDPAAVPEPVRVLFWIESGGSRQDVRALAAPRLRPSALLVRRPGSSVSGRAAKARMFREQRRPIRQIRLTLAELICASWIAWGWSADEALAEIASESYFGHGFKGIHAASFGYFGKPVEDLTLPQAAALVAMTRSPNHYSPWCHPDRLAKRIAVLLATSPEENAARALEGLIVPPPGACS